ncbi:MAG: WXG100 family type VII secretion target [Acidimicrobiaceae bacterium]|nr:WXG100 family type VII secretion target [Acidimicrobiaceae bacterium]
MSGNYSFNSADMESTGTSLGNTANNLLSELSAFSSQVDALNYNTPNSSTQFRDAYGQFKQGYTSVMNGLQGLGQFLNGAGQAFDSTDQQLGSAISGN